MLKSIILALLSAATLTQDKPASLDLTAPEIEAGAPLLNELSRVDAAAAAALQRIFTGLNDDQVLVGAYKWREALKDKERAQQRYDAWLEGVRKAHGCAGCTLDLSEAGKPKLRRVEKAKE